MRPALAASLHQCGTPLGRACGHCGAEVSATAKFCPECGRAVVAPSDLEPRYASPQGYTPKHLAEKILTSRSALAGERKQVTVLCADVKGSMELMADRDPEEARMLLDPALTLMMEAVHRYEGTVNQVMGDGIMALFGAPLAHEDHAVRACYAALGMQDAIARYSQTLRRAHGIEVQIRVGLNSGEVVVRGISSDLHMDYSAIGPTTHLAERVEQLAPAGGIRLTAETFRLVEGFVEVKPLGLVPVKGLTEPVEMFELAGPGPTRTRWQAVAARGLTRFVGREAELDMLERALSRSEAGHGQIAALVGEAGVGKSRLAWEFAHSSRTDGWLVLESGSVSYGKTTAYLPVIDLLRAYCKIQDRDDQRTIREKVTGKLLTLDRSLESGLPAFLALLDVGPADAAWLALDPPSGASTRWPSFAGSFCARPPISRCCWSSRTSTGSMRTPMSCSTAWPTGSRPYGSCSWSTTGRSIATGGGASPATRNSGSIRLRRRAPRRFSRRFWARRSASRP